MLLSKKVYSNWREIQDEFSDYSANIDFEYLEDIVEYMVIDYKLSHKETEKLVYAINSSDSEAIELVFN